MPRLRVHCLPPLLVALLCFLLSQCQSSAVAQDRDAPESVELPADPSAWLNSPPITSEMLKGKAAFLYFFEEG